MMENRILECKGVIFYSQIDEAQFFNWLDNIDCIANVQGVGDSIQLDVVTPPSDIALREIISLFHRYEIDKSQLRRFETEQNRHWFTENKHAFWHKDLFKIDTTN